MEKNLIIAAMKYKLTTSEDHLSCLECGKGLVGRKDRKFCSLECKNDYNNRRYRDIRRHKNEVIEKLSRNYEILDQLLSSGTIHISREQLVSLGFDDHYITSYRKGLTRHDECACFDIYFARTESKIFHIHREI